MNLTSNQVLPPTRIEAKILVLSIVMSLVGFIAYTITDNLTAHPFTKFQPIPDVVIFILWATFAVTLFITALRISLRGQGLVWRISLFKLSSMQLKNMFRLSKIAWWRVASPAYLKLSVNKIGWNYHLVSRILRILIVCALFTLTFDLVNMALYIIRGVYLKI